MCVCACVRVCVCYLSFVLRGAFLQQLRAQAGDLFLDGQHDVGVVLVSLELIGQGGHAVPHKVVIPREVGLDGLENKHTFSLKIQLVHCVSSNGSNLLTKRARVNTL